MRILVTGGAGFIGSNLVHYLLENRPRDQVIVIDALTYAGNLANLKRWENDARLEFIKGDIADPGSMAECYKNGVDVVFHLAAESHVDRSIKEPAIFVRTNVLGTQMLLDASRHFSVKRFIHVSTDEVYGSLGPEGYFTEETPIAPNSPYSASKASADLLVRAYVQTYDFNAVITRCSNNYGPYQFPEKLIPLFITNAVMDKPLPLYGDGMNVRDWIHVHDHCRALELIMEKGIKGEVYNIGGRSERTNIMITEAILYVLGKPKSLIRFVTDRPGHDRRYAIDPTKIETQIGFRLKISFEEGLKKTIAWYTENRSWWEAVRSGEYLTYYERMYGDRLKT